MWLVDAVRTVAPAAQQLRRAAARDLCLLFATTTLAVDVRARP
jgi:hypothetical protein